MNITTHFQVTIQHEKFGVLLDETFIDPTQFKIFLKMIQGCIELKNDLSTFNGLDFLVHIPHKTLSECIITTPKVKQYELTDHLRSKMETLVSKP